MPAWAEIGDIRVLSWIKHGYRIPFASMPPRSLKPQPFRLPGNPEKRRLLLAEIGALLSKKALVKVPASQLHRPAFYSLLFLVKKATGGYRPVIDVSRLNKFVVCPHFKMETAWSVRQAVRPGDWSFSIDLSDAYLHVPMRRQSQDFLRLALTSRVVYRFTVLPFGLCTAPLVFTRIATAVAQLLRRRGLRVHVYLDDWIFLSQDRRALEVAQPEILSLIRGLGFLVNEKKSQLQVCQRFQYLGLHFDTLLSTVRPADHLIDRVLASAKILFPPASISPRSLMRIIGVLGSVADFVHLGRLRRRPVQFWLRHRWSQRDADLDCLLPVNLDLIAALRQWLDRDWLLRGVPLVSPPTTQTICSDASLVGWGSSLGGHMLSGTWSHAEKHLHINVLELRAVLLALEGFAHLISGQSVLLLADNTTSVSYLRKQGGLRSFDLYDLTRQVYHLTERLGVNLVVRHIPSKRNVLADALSRSRPLATEWRLNPRVFQLLQSLVPLSIDLFATRLNNQLPVFVCPFPDPEAVDTDALSIQWTFQNVMYAFPPPVLLPAVLSKIRLDQVPLVLVIAPLAPRQAWSVDILELSITNALRLPLVPRMLTQAHWSHEDPVILHLHAWMLSGAPYLGLAILRRSSPDWLRVADPPLRLSTTVSGGSTQIGANRLGPLYSIPLDLN